MASTAFDQPETLGAPAPTDQPKYPFINWVAKVNHDHPDLAPDQVTDLYLKKYGPPPDDQMVSLEDFAASVKPANPDRSDAQIKVFYDRTFGIAQRAKDAMAPPPSQENNFVRGFREAVQQNPELAHGVSAFVAATGEKVAGEGGTFTAWKKSAVKDYLGWRDHLAKDSQANDSLTHAWEQATEKGNPGALVDFASRTAGYIVGQVGVVLGVGAVASLLGGPLTGATAALATAGTSATARQAALKPIIGKFVQGLIEKEQAALVAKGVTGEALTQQATKNAAKYIASRTALLPYETFMETGEIGGGAVAKATEEGRNLTGAEITKAAVGSAVAGAIGAAEDIYGLKVLRGNASVNKVLDTMPGATGRVARGAAQGTVLGAAGAVTEGAQTIVEQLGQGVDPTTPESVREQVDAAGVGAFGGAMIGGVQGARTPAQAPPSPVSESRARLRAEIEKLKQSGQTVKAAQAQGDLDTESTADTIGVYDPQVDLDQAIANAKNDAEANITDALTEATLDAHLDPATLEELSRPEEQASTVPVDQVSTLQSTPISVDIAEEIQPTAEESLPPVDLPVTSNNLGGFEGQMPESAIQEPDVLPERETATPIKEQQTIAEEPQVLPEPEVGLAGQEIATPPLSEKDRLLQSSTTSKRERARQEVARKAKVADLYDAFSYADQIDDQETMQKAADRLLEQGHDLPDPEALASWREMRDTIRAAQTSIAITGTERGFKSFAEVPGQGGTTEAQSSKSPTDQWYKDLTKNPAASKYLVPGQKAWDKEKIYRAIDEALTILPGETPSANVQTLLDAVKQDPKFDELRTAEPPPTYNLFDQEDAENFSLTSPPQKSAKAKKETVEQPELFGTGETLQAGVAPIIGREASLDESPLFSKTAQEEQPDQTSLFERRNGYGTQKAGPGQMALFPLRPDASPKQSESYAKDAIRDLAQATDSVSAATGTLRPAPRGVDAGAGVRTVGNRITTDLIQQGRVDLRGQTVDSPESMATISQVFRNPKFETLRFFYLKGNTIVAHEGYSSRMPGVAAFTKKKVNDQGQLVSDETDRAKMLQSIKSRMERVGADGFVVLHNHPSGNPTPSQEDKALTQFLARKLPGFKYHVIINSQKFGVIRVKADGLGTKVRVVPLPQSAIRALSNQAPVSHNQLGKELFNEVDLATIGKAIQTPKEYVTLLYRGSAGTVNAIQEIPKALFARTQEAAQYIKARQRDFGAVDTSSYFPGSEVTDAANALIQAGALLDHISSRGSSVRAGVKPSKVEEPLPRYAVREEAKPFAQEEKGAQKEDKKKPINTPPSVPPKPPKPTAKEMGQTPAFSVDDPTKLDQWRARFQDKYIDTRKVTDAIPGLSDELNAMNYLDTMSGKQDKMVKNFKEQELDRLVGDMDAHGVTGDLLNEYLQAITAKEANAKFAEMNPPNEQEELFGTFDNSALSGMSNADAEEVLARSNHEVMKPLADQVFKILKDTRQLMVKYGEESQATIDQWEKENPNYIPRRREGFQDEENEIGRSQGVAVVGKTVKTALGSQRIVVDVLGHVVSHRLKVIARGERMVPVKVLAMTFMDHPNPDFVRLTKALTLTDIDPATGLTRTHSQKLAGTGPRKRVLDKKTGTVKFVPNVHNFFDENVVPFKVKGVQYGLVFNPDNARALAMARGLKGADVETLHGWMGTVAAGTRWIASVNTQYSLSFGPFNAMRDAMFATMTLENSVLKGQQGAILAQAFNNIKDIYLAARAERNNEKGDLAFAKRYSRFEAAGGTTGWRNLYMTGEEQSREIEAMLNPTRFQKAWKGAGGHAFANWVQDYNAAFENSVRLAVFEAALKKGLPEVKAASMAKDVTVNFNRRGTLSTQIGAGYAFFNASMQGTERVLTTLFEKGQRGVLTDAGKKIVTGGLMLGSMQAVGLAVFGGFKEDEPPEFIKAKSIIIPAPFTEKGYIAIPMALGFNVIPNLGRLAAEAMIYGDPKDKALKFVSASFDALVPVGGAGSIAQFITPTVLDPIVSLYENKDWTGRSIYREDFNDRKPTPGHSRANKDAGAWAVGLSKLVNYAFGGTEYAPGFVGDTAVSPTPEAFEYILAALAGGTGRDFAKINRLWSAQQNNEPIELYNIPLAGRLVGVAKGATQDWGRWQRHMATLHRHTLELKGRKGDAKALKQYRDEHPLAKKVERGRMAESRLRKLLSVRRELAEKPDNPFAVQQKKKADAKIADLITRFNEEMEKAAP